jgi:hypothetical protein
MNKYIDKYAVIVNSDTNEGLLVSNCYVFTDCELHEFEDEEAARDYIEENGIILKEELYEDLYQQDN